MNNIGKVRIFLPVLVVLSFFCTKMKQRDPLSIEISTANCHLCHGKNFSEVNKTGQHASHVAGHTDCIVCHVNDSLGHLPLDGIVTMRDSLAVSQSNVCDSCHGSGGIAAKTYWTAPSGVWKNDSGYCEGCHDGSGIFAGKTAPNVVWHYANTGHGNSGSFLQTRHKQNGPGYSCQFCHDPFAPGHFDQNVGDTRLWIPNDSSAVCLDCHRVGKVRILGDSAVTKMSVHSYRVTGKYTNVPEYDYECNVCHNPHGTSNIAMINDTVDGNLGAGPIAVSFKDSLDFDPTLSAIDGICDACHDGQGGYPHSNTNRGMNHQEGNACWSCMQHDTSFANRP